MDIRLHDPATTCHARTTCIHIRHLEDHPSGVQTRLRCQPHDTKTRILDTRDAHMRMRFSNALDSYVHDTTTSNVSRYATDSPFQENPIKSVKSPSKIVKIYQFLPADSLYTRLVWRGLIGTNRGEPMTELPWTDQVAGRYTSLNGCFPES